MNFPTESIVRLAAMDWFITATFTPGPEYLQIAMKKAREEPFPGMTEALVGMIKKGDFEAVTDFCDKPESKEVVFTLKIATLSKSDSSVE